MIFIESTLWDVSVVSSSILDKIRYFREKFLSIIKKDAEGGH